jgi:choline dehydrogenase-like flavoprotein
MRHPAPIALAEAAARGWDAVIAGTSFAAMFLLRGLPPDWEVLLVEKGPLVDHAAQLAARGLPAEAIPQDNRSGLPKDWTLHPVHGGNSNCWWGQVPRMHPDDFKLASLSGAGPDWLFGYDDLEPYWTEVEAVMEVAGGGTDHILPRSGPFPFPPHIPSRSDRVLQADPLWTPAPSARSNGASRGQCCANGVCDLCPIDAKFTVLNAGAAFERPGVRLLRGEMRALRVEAGTATAALVRAGGTEAEIRAPLFALGAGGIHNPAILMRSGIGGPAVGRYLHEQIGQEVLVDIAIPNWFGGTSITGHGWHFWHAADRRAHAPVLVENWNAPAALRQTRHRWTERLKLKLIAEDRPRSDNRVILRDDEPAIEWLGHDAWGLAGLKAALDRLPDILPRPVEAMQVLPIKTTEHHIQGTSRIGPPGEGVVDGALRCHDARNVLALGSGAFPTCSPANPTLTLAALSLRAARMLA